MLQQMNAKNAILNVILQEEAYVEQPYSGEKETEPAQPSYV